MQAKTHFKEALNAPIFKTLSEVADQLNLEAYVIGGYVRDFFLDRGTHKDIDVVAIGSGIALAKAVAKALPENPKVSVFKWTRNGDDPTRRYTVGVCRSP